MKDPRAEEMDDTQSYIEQMVAATTARAVPEPDPDEEEEGLGFDDELEEVEETDDSGDGDFDEIAEEEFVEFEEEED
jgi:hypothetical protein